jgi:pimeloyl-ACP methyl ester carboxylesterase
MYAIALGCHCIHKRIRPTHGRITERPNHNSSEDRKALIMTDSKFHNSSINNQTVAVTTAKTQVKNIVLVHGALADASGWRAVYDILKQQGYHVSLASQPLTSRAADVAAVRRLLDLQTGPVILVGHSYGGALITESGNDPKVKALVYVAALQPDAGESPFELLQSKPAASQAVQFTADGYAYIDPSHYQEDFAADLPKADTDFMADSQMLVAVECLQTPVSIAAWREKPSYAIVATEDRSLSPDLQRFMYQRSKSEVTELKGSHAIYISQPEAVAAVIVAASHQSI